MKICVTAIKEEEKSFVAMVTVRYGSWGNANTVLENKVFTVSFENAKQVKFAPHKSNEISISRFWVFPRVFSSIYTM